MTTDSGKKRALLIGINYTDEKQKTPLKDENGDIIKDEKGNDKMKHYPPLGKEQSRDDTNGPYEDIRRMRSFLIERFAFKSEDITMMHDLHKQSTDEFYPSRVNLMGDGQQKVGVIKQWADAAKPGDSLFFFYSGHGHAEVLKHKNPELHDEFDIADELIVPADYSNGEIADDDLYEHLVKNLPKDCQLVALFDSCHNGSILDLTHRYVRDEQAQWVKHDAVQAHAAESRACAANVICFSGSADNTAAMEQPLNEDKRQPLPITMGVAAYAFRKVLRERKNISFLELHQHMVDVVTEILPHKPWKTHPVIQGALRDHKDPQDTALHQPQLFCSDSADVHKPFKL